MSASIINILLLWETSFTVILFELDGHSVERTYLRQSCSHGSRWIKPFYNHASLQRQTLNTCMWDFPDVIKFRVAAHTIPEKAIRFRHQDYNLDRAQKLISSSMSRRLSTRNMSSKSIHTFLSNLANRQTDKRTRANAFTSSFVGGNNEIVAVSSNNKNLATANRSRVSCAHNTSRASIVTPWPSNLGEWCYHFPYFSADLRLTSPQPDTS